MINITNLVPLLIGVFLFTLLLNALAFAVVNNWKPKEMWTLLVTKWDKIIFLILASYVYIVGTLFLGTVIFVYVSQHGWL